MVGPPHPQSVIRTDSGRIVQLKIHQCQWQRDYPANSLQAIQDCYRSHVARAEIDVAILRDRDFLIAHDLDMAKVSDGRGWVAETTAADSRRLYLAEHGTVTRVHPALLSEVVSAIAEEPYPTLLELDLKDWKPWPWPRVEELARMLEPVKDRITFGGGADWNLRRLHKVDPSLPMGFTITAYLDWLPNDGRPESSARERGAYGYFDEHPLAREKLGSTADYLRDRLGALVRLVPDVRDIHIRLLAVERMLQDGLTDLADMLHANDMLLDVWTLNAGTSNWRERLASALAAGADVITTDTPHELVAAAPPA